MAIKRNPYYMRTLDDILPQLSKAKTISMGDATSGYWHVPPDLASSLLTTFSTPYGKFRWLKLPFGLKIASDIFQERLDRVLALVPNTIGIADSSFHMVNAQIKGGEERRVNEFKTKAGTVLQQISTNTTRT